MSTVKELRHVFEQQLSNEFTAQEKMQLAKEFLAHYLDCPPAQLLLKNEETVDDAVYTQVKNAIVAINKGEPTHYVLGTTYFYDLPLKVDRRALIPRPETEELVDWIRTSISLQSPKILDVGTGSGCIALALETIWGKATIWGVDYSTPALDLAKENAKLLQSKVHFEKADALDLSKTLTEKWDVIVSNPPYVLFSDKQKMQAHVVDYEPHEALFVDNQQPIIFYERIGKYALHNLNPEGKLFFEINEDFAQSVKDALLQMGFSNVIIKKDLQGKNRMICAVI